MSAACRLQLDPGAPFHRRAQQQLVEAVGGRSTMVRLMNHISKRALCQSTSL
jgi:hypothetical protein